MVAEDTERGIRKFFLRSVLAQTTAGTLSPSHLAQEQKLPGATGHLHRTEGICLVLPLNGIAAAGTKGRRISLCPT